LTGKSLSNSTKWQKEKDSSVNDGVASLLRKSSNSFCVAENPSMENQSERLIREELKQKMRKTRKKLRPIDEERVKQAFEKKAVQGKLEPDEDDREIARALLYSMAEELKAKNPNASIQEIREWLKQMIDVSVEF
jgi:hypothetical protein